MKIIKEGFNFRSLTMVFECQICGCVYRAYFGEYMVLGHSTQYVAADKKLLGYRLKCICPNCGIANDKDFLYKEED